MIRSKNLPLRFLTVIAFIFLIACSSDDDSGDSNRGPLLSGFAQKGSFVKGSAIYITLLDETGMNAIEFHTEYTKNDMGEFSVNYPPGSVLLIEAEGNFRDEITGKLSSTPLSLKAYYVVREDGIQNVNVNILTHMIHMRVKGSILSKNMKPADAILEAETELRRVSEELDYWLQGFKKLSDMKGHFTDWSVYNSPFSPYPESNAYLLWFSSYVNHSNILKNLTTDESFDSKRLQTVLDAFSRSNINYSDHILSPVFSLEFPIRGAVRNAFDPDKVVNVLRDLIQQSGLIAAPADLNAIMDSDLDGTVNVADLDDDGDGVLDVNDKYPYDATRS